MYILGLLAFGLGLGYTSPPVLQRVRLNNQLCYDAGRGSSRAASLLRSAEEDRTINTPYAGDALVAHATRSSSLSSSFGMELLGVVGPLSVRWTLSLDTENSTHLPLRITIAQSEGRLATEGIVVDEVIAADSLVWTSSGSALQLRPHARYVLRIGAVVAIRFRAGPHGGIAGDASSGWTAKWVGGANAITASIDFTAAAAAAAAPADQVTSLILYASTPGTMSWSASGQRLHDSVLDPGYSNEATERAIYVAYDLLNVTAPLSLAALGTVAIKGSLGFGKYGYLAQWCNCGSNPFGKPAGPGACALSAKCRPFTAQVVATTSSGRVLIAGTGSRDIVELAPLTVSSSSVDGGIVATFLDANTWAGRADGAPFMFTHLYHGEIYDATKESGGPPFVPLLPWDISTHPMGPVAPHAFPAIRPSEAPVVAVRTWVPGPVAGNNFSVVFDFGQNFAGACELTLEGATAALAGAAVNLRYGESLETRGESKSDLKFPHLFHPWWPCSGHTSQGAHNCANQTDRYIVRGAPGVVGFSSALGRVPMRTRTHTGAAQASSLPTTEVYSPSHSLKGARWVQMNGTAVTRGLRFALPAGDMCAPPATATPGALVPCSEPRKSSDVVVSLKFWPLHSDVSLRGAARLFAVEGNTSTAARSSGWSVDTVNALQKSIVRTHLNNLHSIPTDCPHRERRGWGGDAQLTSGSAAVNLDMSSFYQNWVKTMRNIQTVGGSGGDMPSFVPRARSSGDKDPTWAAIASIVPWEQIVRTGEDSLLTLGFATTKSLISYWEKFLDADGLLNQVLYGDWNPSLRSGPSHGWGQGSNCPQLFTSHATYIECLDRGIDLALMAGDAVQATAWATLAKTAREGFERRWWNSSIGCYAQNCSGQTMQAVPLALNITNATHRADAVAALIHSVTTWNTSLIVGIQGARFIYEALVNVGRGDLALKLVGRDVDACDYTSGSQISCTFSQQLTVGPGTLWESYDYASTWTGSSLNHIMFAGGAGLFIHRAAGLTQAAWGRRRGMRLGRGSAMDSDVAVASAAVTFELDEAIASQLGGARVWSNSARGEAMLHWRLQSNRCLAIEVVGPAARRSERASWRVVVTRPRRLLLSHMQYRAKVEAGATSTLLEVRGPDAQHVLATGDADSALTFFSKQTDVSFELCFA